MAACLRACVPATLTRFTSARAGTLIIFLYLLDNEHTSVIILASMFASVVIDGWKVSKVVEAKVAWYGPLPVPTVTITKSATETKTEQFDTEAMV